MQPRIPCTFSSHYSSSWSENRHVVQLLPWCYWQPLKFLFSSLANVLMLFLTVIITSLQSTSKDLRKDNYTRKVLLWRKWSMNLVNIINCRYCEDGGTHSSNVNHHFHMNLLQKSRGYAWYWLLHVKISLHGPVSWYGKRSSRLYT